MIISPAGEARPDQCTVSFTNNELKKIIKNVEGIYNSTQGKSWASNMWDHLHVELENFHLEKIFIFSCPLLSRVKVLLHNFFVPC